jgi:hypothetical protein
MNRSSRMPCSTLRTSFPDVAACQRAWHFSHNDRAATDVSVGMRVEKFAIGEFCTFCVIAHDAPPAIAFGGRPRRHFGAVSVRPMVRPSSQFRTSASRKINRRSEIRITGGPTPVSSKRCRVRAEHRSHNAVSLNVIYSREAGRPVGGKPPAGCGPACVPNSSAAPATPSKGSFEDIVNSRNP